MLEIWQSLPVYVGTHLDAAFGLVKLILSLLRLRYIVMIKDVVGLELARLPNLTIFIWHVIVADNFFGLLMRVYIRLLRVPEVSSGTHDCAIIFIAKLHCDSLITI